MSSTKQAKSQWQKKEKREGTKTPSVTDWRTKLWEHPGSVEGQFSSGQRTNIV